ncbi:hypothetical protein PSHT_10071 [Puccinia striiformis]|uniref:Glycosyltransferase family 28 N-terminal domain-containing protein n=1 Tax=Puccinia striiformis TaxID=27350 RepID=A0A2S4VCC4_9BASI|nr:hypothetical protein PSHT_10071 [Puccinia striiformis]
MWRPIPTDPVILPSSDSNLFPMSEPVEGSPKPATAVPSKCLRCPHSPFPSRRGFNELVTQIHSPIHMQAHIFQDIKTPISLSMPPAMEPQRRPPKSMKITCLTIGTRGDVQPYIALCQRLNELGHTCTIATHKNFRHWIETSGILFAEIDGDPEELIEHCVEFGVLSPFFWWNGFSRFSPWFDGLLASSWKACQGSDLLIESPSALIGVHIAQSLNIPYYRAFTMPWTQTGAYFHAMLAMSDSWGSWLNRMSYVLFDLLIWVILSSRINTWRKFVLGLEATTFSQLRLDQVPFLYNFSPLVVPRPDDWKPWVTPTGYWFVKSQENEKYSENSIPEELRKMLHQAKQSHRSRPRKNHECYHGAVKESNVFAIISGGWTAQHADKMEESAGMRADINQHRDSMYYVDSIPHEWLFSQIDAALHHGGAGTTAASIRAGIPTMIKPFFGRFFTMFKELSDKSARILVELTWLPSGARRVEHLGVGTYVKTFEKEDILRAISRATTDEVQIKQARLLGQNIRLENGVDTAIKAIYEYLDYSQCLIDSTVLPPYKLNPITFPKRQQPSNRHFPARSKTYIFLVLQLIKGGLMMATVHWFELITIPTLSSLPWLIPLSPLESWRIFRTCIFILF